jgi:hypothetical protein
VATVTAIDLIFLTIGLVVFFLSERHINKMTKHTWAVMRVVYSMVAASGLAVAALPWCYAVWCGPVAFTMMAVSGLALAICNQRGCNIFGCRTIDQLLKRFHELED